MKTIILISLYLLSFSSLSKAVFHDISRGKHHKGGEISIEVIKKTDTSFVANLAYKIKKKIYVPIGNSKLRGQVDQALPISFSTLEGYIDLEAKKSIKVDRATVKFIKRESVGEFYDSYKIQIIPDNKKWVGFLWYHPSVEGTGWFKSSLTLLSIPVLGDYSLNSYIR